MRFGGRPPQGTDRRIITSSTRKEHGTSGVNLAAQATCARRRQQLLVRNALAPGVLPSEEYFGGCMAKMIEFYIPQSLRKVSKWLPQKERGKLLEFPVAVRKSA